MTMRILGPYYYGKHKWDNYLLDIQDTIKSREAAQRQGSRLQSKALDAANRQQLAELHEQTEQMRRIEDALHGGFEELRAEFEWGFTLMVDRMDTMIDHLSQIAARLDAIHKTLQSPLLTQARELFQLGQERFRKGLLDKALEAYLKAEQKNEVDFPLQLQIGKLFLYGRDEDDDVIDLPQAEKHLLFAARYADAEKGTFPQWNEYCGQAYFHAAVAAYLIGEQEETAGRLDSMRSSLERALGYLAKAAILWPRFTEIVYTQAKCHALLGQTQDATRKLEILSDRDRRYFAKASRDGDFQTFHAAVEELFSRAKTSPGPLAGATQAKLDEVAESVAWAKLSIPTSRDDLAIVESVVRDPSVAMYVPGVDTTRLKELPSQQKIEEATTAIESIARELSRARQSLPTLEVDIEGMSERLTQMRANLEKIANDSFQSIIYGCEQVVSSSEQRKTGCENLVQQLTQTMKATSGAGMGWLFFFVFLVGSNFVLSIALNLLLALAPEIRGVLQNMSGAIAVFGWIAIGIVGALIGSSISRSNKNRPHKLKIEEYSRTIDECVRKLPTLRDRAKTWKQEKQSFATWQAQRSSPPPLPS